MNNKNLKESLEVYLNYLKKLSQISSYIPTRTELNTLAKLHSESIKNINLNNLMSEVSKIQDIKEKESLINEFIKHQILDNVEEKKELISQIYGVGVSEIEHRKLQNEKEIFLFYDDKLQRKRILENPKTEYLLELNKTKKEEKINKEELQMIFIRELYKYEDLFKKLSKKELSNIKLLINKAKVLNFEYIDVLNQLALDKDNNIFESYYDEKEGISKLSKPREIVYESKNKEIDPDLLYEINNYISYSKENNVNEIYSRIKYYYNHMEKLQNLSKEEKDFYEKMVTLYAEKRTNELRKNRKFKLENNPQMSMAGYTNIFIVSIITLLILFILSVIYRLN